jgi:hypothetical protein
MITRQGHAAGSIVKRSQLIISATRRMLDLQQADNSLLRRDAPKSVGKWAQSVWRKPQIKTRQETCHEEG